MTLVYVEENFDCNKKKPRSKKEIERVNAK